VHILTLTIVVVAYLFAVGYLGYRGYRATRGVTDYLVAGRQAHPYIMAMSYGATFISTSAIVGFGGAAALFGLGLLWLTFLNIFIGIFIAFVLFGERTRRMAHNLDAHTFPELLGRRYESRFLQGFSGFVIFLFMPLYAGVVLMGAAKFIEEALRVEYGVALFVFAVIVAAYVILGGLKGVMYTDALQGSIMLVGMIALLIITYTKLGGIIEAHKGLTNLAPLAVEQFGKLGHRGWTAMPEFGSVFWWTLVSTIVMGVGIGVLAQPQLAIRFMTVRGKRELNRAVLVGGIFVLAMTGVAFVVGALSNLYFYTTQGKIALAAAGGEVGKIIPAYIKSAMPLWFVYLFMLTLLAAAMSTVSSQFHVMGTSIGRDFYERGVMAGRQAIGTVAVTRLGIFVAFCISVALAYILPTKYAKQGVAIIARGTAIFFGMCAAAFLPAYIGALFTRWVTRAGAIWGVVIGFVSSTFWLVFVHRKEAEALLICNKLFGKPSLLAGVKTGKIIWEQVDPLFVAFPLALIVTFLISAFTKPPSLTHLRRCFDGIAKE